VSDATGTTHSATVTFDEPFHSSMADHDRVDDRTQSKWSCMLRYAAEHKHLGKPLHDFIKRKSGINRYATRFARALGEIFRY
jgi:hypothetical protein